MRRANRENWKDDRDKAASKAVAKLQQRTADAIVNNAEITYKKVFCATYDAHQQA